MLYEGEMADVAQNRFQTYFLTVFFQASLALANMLYSFSWGTETHELVR